MKATAWAKERVSIFHYRDKDQLEVDFVLENAAGQVVGIEVKAAASVTCHYGHYGPEYQAHLRFVIIAQRVVREAFAGGTLYAPAAPDPAR